MSAVIVNTVAVIVGGCIGLLLKKGIPERFKDAVMKGIGLCTMYIGISGALKGQNTLVLILSMVIGVIIGVALRLDDRLNGLAGKIEAFFARKGGSESGEAGKKTSIAEGFVTASILFCIGAMTIVGSMEAGLTGDTKMLLTKSMLDFISSIVFASALGVGVVMSAAFVLVFQGGLVLLSQYVQPFLSDYVVAEMTCAGSILILAIGMNIIGITKLKVTNFLPAVFLPIILCMILK